MLRCANEGHVWFVAEQPAQATLAIAGFNSLVVHHPSACYSGPALQIRESSPPAQVMRIYIVRGPNATTSLVKAKSRAQALSAVAKSLPAWLPASVQPASALEVAELINKHALLDATAEPVESDDAEPAV